MNLVNKKTQAGQDIRLLNVNASPSNHSFDVFENLDGSGPGASRKCPVEIRVWIADRAPDNLP
jgi:hypothetical protein